uniref:LIM and calponin homology domains 1a n=1 Tax=Poecilia formosa TaxID=48698 RepID=A0A087XUQ6_POEFO
MAGPEPSHPEPACLEAQKWIEAATGKSFGDKDFRSALENGILLCELLSAIKPGLVKKINRLPTPIAGLDNLSVFLRGCEELGLKGSQLFDPGDLQDTSIRANLKDSDCNRKLKNVLNTVFWLGKAASGCPSYTGPNLNLKEFEGLLAQMKLESDDGGDISQKRSVRDSGYDCWDSERSESLSPPQHTRDNSLDSLDSFGSRSQHSPSPDVVNRGNSDGRGSDSEADAPSRKPDVRKDDMLARRTASSDSRCPVPFNQFLPNRANASCYIPTPRRKQHPEEGEQRSTFITARDVLLGEKPAPSLPQAYVSLLSRSVSMGDMANEDEAGHVPSLSPSRYERMHQQYNAFVEEEDQWQDDLARWKNRRRSASQELIKKEEERKRIEKRMKGNGVDGNKRKSIKTYKEIVEEKERREAELCEAYRQAATPEEAALVLQRYALRFTISDATLDSLKLPRSTNKPNQFLNQTEQEHSQTSGDGDSERLEHPNQLDTDGLTEQPPTEPAAAPQPKHKLSSLPSAPSRPLPLLAAKHYCPPRCSPEHKLVEVQQLDGSVRLNGETAEDFASLPDLLQENPAISSQHTQEPDPPEDSAEQPEPPLTERPALTSGSAISSLIAGRNCIITTTIVTELTKTHVEPLHPDVQDDVESEKTNKNQGEEHDLMSPELMTTRMTKCSPIPDLLIYFKYNPQDGATETPAEKGNPQPVQSPSSLPEYSPSVSEGLEESSVTTCVLTFPLFLSLLLRIHLVCLLVGSGQIETPMLNLAKRVNHWVWDPNEERKRLESWQQEQERLLQEQYQKEQEKLKKEWEKAQLEVEEEERKHNEEERRILEETVAPLSPSASVQRQPERIATAPFSAEENNNGAVRGNVSAQQNGQKIHTGSEDQHASKLHFFQETGNVEDVISGPQPSDQPDAKCQKVNVNMINADFNSICLWSRPKDAHTSASVSQQVNNVHTPTREDAQVSAGHARQCVSGKRLCSGCSKPLGRGAAMIIDTLGLFFHMQCFKCGVCKGQLGDATAGTDVRIRNGLLSCYECYIASRGRGQPTPL